MNKRRYILIIFSCLLAIVLAGSIAQAKVATQRIWYQPFFSFGQKVYGGIDLLSGALNLHSNKVDFNKGSSEIRDDGHLRISTDDDLYLNAPRRVLTQNDLQVGGSLIVNNQGERKDTGSVVYDDGHLRIKTDDWLYLTAPESVIVSNRLEVSNGFSVASGNVNLPNASLTNSMLGSESVTTEKIANGTILSGDLANDAITDDKVVDTITASNYLLLTGGTVNGALVLTGNFSVGGTSLVVNAGTSQVAIGTAVADSSALLDLTSTSKGFLPPRMTTAQRDAISSPATGLVIFNTSTNELNTYQDGAWQSATKGALRLLTESPNVPLDETVYFWRNWATTGYQANEYEVSVPFDESHYATYGFVVDATSGITNYGKLKESVPCINTAHASLTKVGTWSSSSDARVYTGSAARSSAAGDTIGGTVTGHSLFIRTWQHTNSGFATVAIDGDYTKANLLPAVTQAEVDAGYFSSGDIGKRYFDNYSNLVFYDEQIAIAEGLDDVAHTVTVRVQGTKRSASTDTRVYVSAIMGSSVGNKPTDPSGSMCYVRQIANQRTTGVLADQTIVPSYNPAGFSNTQFIGGIHGNEDAVSATWYVDGTSTTLTADQYASGKEIRLERVTNLKHPSTGSTVVGVKRIAYSARADRSLPLTANYAIQWKNAGQNSNTFYGMLHAGVRRYDISALTQTIFDRVLLGDTLISDLTANDESSKGRVKADTAAFFSTSHDTVAVVTIPRPDLNVNGWAKGGATYTTLQDRADGTDKIYFTRSSSSNPEDIAVGDVHRGTIGWRIMRIEDAASRLTGTSY